MTEHDPVHVLCLVVGAACPPIFLCVKVAHGEQGQPSAAVYECAMRQHAGRCEPVVVLSQDVVHHLRDVADQVEPDSAGHLLLGEVHTRHVYHCLPLALSEVVGRLTTCGGVNNVRSVGGEVGAEILGDPCYKKILLPRIPYYREPGLTSLSGVTAATASDLTVEYSQLSPICEQIVELSRMMMSSHSITRLLRIIH